MRKYFSLLIIFTLVACGSTSDDSDAIDVTTTTRAEVTITTQQANDSTTTTEATISYTFDVEKMSPFTGLELPAETWLKRPRRVIAFKIDNNINARPQSCHLYTSPSPRDGLLSRMPSSA